MRDTKKVILRGLAGVALAIAAIGSVGAQQLSGFYAGASVGQSKASDACNGVDASIGFSGTCDDTDTGFKIFGGYEFTKNVGLEIAYVDFGKSEAVGTLSGSPATGSFEANGFTVHGVGTLPINDQFSVFGKLGLIRWSVEGNASVTGLGSASISENGVDFAAGIGAAYHFTPNIGLRAEYEIFTDLGDADTTGTSDVHLISVGLIFKF